MNQFRGYCQFGACRRETHVRSMAKSARAYRPAVFFIDWGALPLLAVGALVPGALWLVAVLSAACVAAALIAATRACWVALWRLACALAA